jgi:hypothetical protein
MPMPVVRKVRSIARRGERASLRLAITFLALLAFSVQSYVTQTHIHGAPASSGIAKAEQPAQPHDRYPANDDPANCPICQEILHAGHYVTPAAVAVLLPSVAVSTIAIVLDVPIALRSVSHSWHGRAPPRI